MKEATVRQYIQNSDTPDKYSWAGLDRFPDGRNWKWWPRHGGASKMKLSDLPVGTLIMMDVGWGIYKVVEQKEDGIIIEIIDNQDDQFKQVIGSTKELNNYMIPGKVTRYKYVCLPEDDVVDEQAAEKAKEGNQKITESTKEEDLMDMMMDSFIGDLKKTFVNK